jgi:spore coat protein H
MRNRFLAVLTGWVLILPTVAGADDRPKKESPGADVFGLTRMWEIHIAIPAKEYELMQPAGVGFFGGGPGAPGFPKGPPPRPPADRPVEVHKGGSFGIEFPWARGEVAAGGRTYKDVALRYKGGGSYVMAAGKLKRNLKVDLDRHDAEQRFHGLKAINLNAGALDPTKVREALGYAIYGAAGVPAPRTAFAEVTLTVPGKLDRELLGTYTLVEQVDKTFLKDHFGDGTGLLLKPEVRMGMMRGPLTYQGDDWRPYNDALRPKDEPTKEQAQRVIAFIKLVDRAGDAEFRKEIGSYLDIDQFLRFLAATSFLANTDSFFVGGHNAYVYLNPKSNKFVLLPWDLDLAFGGFFLLGTPDQHADLSLTHPYPGENKLIDRILAIKDVSERYQSLLKELSATAFKKETLLSELEAVQQATKEPLAREDKVVAARKEAGGFGLGFGPPPDLRKWVEKRTVSVAAQLDGKSKGWVPVGFGPPGGAPAPRLGEILPGPVQNALRLTEDQKRRLAELQKEVDGRVEELLTPGQRRQLKEMRDRAPGGPPKRPGGPG